MSLLAAGSDYSVKDNGKMSAIDYLKMRHPNSLAAIQKAIAAGPIPKYRQMLKEEIENSVVRIGAIE